MATQAIPPPHIGDFWARTREFSEKPADLWKRCGFEKKVADFRKKGRIFQETFLMKRLAKFYAWVIQASNNIYLFGGEL